LLLFLIRSKDINLFALLCLTMSSMKQFFQWIFPNSCTRTRCQSNLFSYNIEIWPKQLHQDNDGEMQTIANIYRFIYNPGKMRKKGRINSKMKRKLPVITLLFKLPLFSIPVSSASLTGPDRLRSNFPGFQEWRRHGHPPRQRIGFCWGDRVAALRLPAGQGDRARCWHAVRCSENAPSLERVSDSGREGEFDFFLNKFVVTSHALEQSTGYGATTSRALVYHWLNIEAAKPNGVDQWVAILFALRSGLM